jgi:hypothetical protein
MVAKTAKMAKATSNSSKVNPSLFRRPFMASLVLRLR